MSTTKSKIASSAAEAQAKSAKMSIKSKWMALFEEFLLVCTLLPFHIWKIIWSNDRITDVVEYPIAFSFPNATGQGQDPSESNPNFWDELFLLKIHGQFLTQQLCLKSTADIISNRVCVM